MKEHSEQELIPYLYRANVFKNNCVIYFNSLQVIFQADKETESNNYQEHSRMIRKYAEKAYVFVEYGRRVRIDPKTICYFDGLGVRKKEGFCCIYQA